MANYKPKPRKMEKFCVGCEQMRPRHEFYELPRGGLSKYCQDCHRVGMARYHNMKRRSEIDGYPCLSHREFRQWLDKQEKVCYYCGTELEIELTSGRSMNIEKLIPEDGYVLGNIALACFRCNKVKSDVFTPKEMKKVVEIFDFAHRPTDKGYKFAVCPLYSPPSL